MNKPLAASVAQVSDLATELKPNAPDSFICPASDIFDRNRIAAELAAALDDLPNERDIRAATVAVLSHARDAGRAIIASSFQAQPFASRTTTHAYSWLTDQIVELVLEVSTTRLHPLPNPTQGEKLSLIAVGGYGRGEMAPESDVDLLFLTPYKMTPWAESVIESMLYMLWDLKLKVGHASRTVKDCIRLAPLEHERH